MVKWYNGSLPRISRGFDYPWPHKEKSSRKGLFLSAARVTCWEQVTWVIEILIELDWKRIVPIWPIRVLLLYVNILELYSCIKYKRVSI